MEASKINLQVTVRIWGGGGSLDLKITCPTQRTKNRSRDQFVNTFSDPRNKTLFKHNFHHHIFGGSRVAYRLLFSKIHGAWKKNERRAHAEIDLTSDSWRKVTQCGVIVSRAATQDDPH